MLNFCKTSLSLKGLLKFFIQNFPILIKCQNHLNPITKPFFQRVQPCPPFKLTFYSKNDPSDTDFIYSSFYCF